ncbi:MucR family transcriptional regulator [Gluconobacter cerinus]|uniref:MucR family transcriptional regulator n=1 Tax=Gluconobacter cerinus TaxID=38307 RepID=UPI001B8BA53A|nr:MucR family transcriptional regulator [Gluconobacter cerinus]MBS1023500.1 MucR family transcriptional regulator [Gluconobacter cerinus]
MNHKLTADIVAAYLSRNEIETEQLPSLIRVVYETLQTPSLPEEIAEEAPVPAVNPKRSVFPDYIICLEDGKKLKMLKRHLLSVYNMTPADYRKKWGLPDSYPMVCPSYSERRSSLAKEIGLGNKVKKKAETEVRQIPEAKRGRPKQK